MKKWILVLAIVLATTACEEVGGPWDLEIECDEIGIPGFDALECGRTVYLSPFFLEPALHTATYIYDEFTHELVYAALNSNGTGLGFVVMGRGDSREIFAICSDPINLTDDPRCEY